MKDKILCALKNNVLSLKGSPSNYWLSTRRTFIELGATKLYTETVVMEYTKNWWGKTVEKETVKRNQTGMRYHVSGYGKEFDITLEEYQDVIDHRETEIKTRDIKELEDLCK